MEKDNGRRQGGARGGGGESRRQGGGNVAKERKRGNRKPNRKRSRRTQRPGRTKGEGGRGGRGGTTVRSRCPEAGRLRGGGGGGGGGKKKSTVAQCRRGRTTRPNAAGESEMPSGRSVRYCVVRLEGPPFPGWMPGSPSSMAGPTFPSAGVRRGQENLDGLMCAGVRGRGTPQRRLAAQMGTEGFRRRSPATTVISAISDCPWPAKCSKQAGEWADGEESWECSIRRRPDLGNLSLHAKTCCTGQGQRRRRRPGSETRRWCGRGKR